MTYSINTYLNFFVTQCQHLHLITVHSYPRNENFSHQIVDRYARLDSKV